jgi:hypothetical protein
MDEPREARLYRLARRNHLFFHKARIPFYERGVNAKYYITDETDLTIASYADLQTAEDELAKRSTRKVES